MSSPSDEGQELTSEDFNPAGLLKKKRKQSRRRVTLAIKRIIEVLDKGQGEDNRRRLQKEIEQLRKDYETAREQNGELFELVDEGEYDALDKWENELTSDVFSIEEKVENSLDSLADHPHPSLSGKSSSPAPNKNASAENTAQASGTTEFPNNKDQASPPKDSPTSHVQNQESSNELSTVGNHANSHASNPPDSHGETPGSQQTIQTSGQASVSNSVALNTVPNPQTKIPIAFDSWIDDLVEFQETSLSNSDPGTVTIADALFKLEARKDIPSIQLPLFNGDALSYTDFIDHFKIHIHDKAHLTDDMRMIQLRMHLKGEAERSISGLGSKGIMYATALKALKEQFGQPSVIVRAVVNKLTRGDRISRNNRQALKEFSLDIINCLAIMHRLHYCADVNANENLRRIVLRFPDHLIEKWKGAVADIREKGHVPTLQHISDFVRKRVRAEFDPDFGDIQRGARNELSSGGRGIHAAGRHSNIKERCHICEAGHKVPECPTLLDSTVDERFELVRKSRLCFSCLGKGHLTRECKTKKRCGRNGCHRYHHSLLHNDPPSVTGVSSILDRNGILRLVRVRFRAPNGRVREGNVLIDSGAATTVIRKDFAKALGLQGRRERIDLAVVGGERIEQPESRRVKFWISALHSSEEFDIEAHEIEKTTLSVPALDRQWLSSFPHLSALAFPHKAGPVDLILGVQYSHLHAEDEIRQGLPFEPVAKRTKLGWLVIGSDNLKEQDHVCAINLMEPLNLERFYEFETLGVQAKDCPCPNIAVSRDEKRAMELMESSCKRLGNRYTIGLPWKKDKALLPNNYRLAERRLFSLERNLLKDKAKAKMYDEAIMDYEKNGWARALSEREVQAGVKPVYYLPHHGIYRPEKKSTPLRIVFDPACQFQGVSLNSLLHKGPCLIGNLLGVLLRFREEPVAFVGDISKMYLQISLPEEDTHVHRFLWRNLDTTRQPTTYALQRVTFGDKPSPDMASFVMLKIADDNAEDNPNAAKILRKDRYMDDLIHSCPTPGKAIQSIKELDRVLATGSFQIKEWLSSSNAVQQSLNSYQKNLNMKSHLTTPVTMDGEKGVKTLGVGWNPRTDVLSFAVKETTTGKFTKRTILSNISKLYDPLGLASAVTIKAKIALQNIWRSKHYDWDDLLPDDMVELWRNLFREIQSLKAVEFPRCLQPECVSGLSQLHVFADASGSAYGGVAYLLWPTPEGPEVRLVSAKARVAPLRQPTIPRLELMAALIASRLAKTIYDEFKIKPSSVTLWSDSKIVLHWLRSESASLKAFVGVRVTEIQSTWDPSLWRFVPTEQNPADDLSRGIPADGINGRWKTGPEFLKRPPEEWPNDENPCIEEDPERKRTRFLGLFADVPPVMDATRYSSWQRLARITAYVLRLVHNLKVATKSPTERRSGTLQPAEIESAERHWIKEAQRSLTNFKEHYADLTPFLQDDIVRVGGRLRRSSLVYDQVHPILLPSSLHISALIMKSAHLRVFHAGCERTLAESRRRYWIVRGRGLAKKLVRDCATCRKLRKRPHTTLMADLPPERMKPFSPPFLVTGVDLFGRFNLKYGRNKSTKAWGALFTCATVRAIHLEIVENLSAEAFLQALRRFVSHHGWPDTFISDNGKCFVGAERELKKLLVEGRNQINDFAVLHKVRWIFTTPLSPHQGGIYESLIKQTKRALRVAIGNQVLSWNEMATVFAEVKSLINSRPLGYSSSDPNDPQPLTPNHLLLGRASPCVPQGPFEESRNPRKRFAFIQSLAQHFWRRFVREYVPTLMRRSKWYTKGRQVKVGDVVLIVDYNCPRGKWDLALVKQVYPGADGVVRNVLLKTKSGEYKRSVQKCCIIIEAE